MLARSAISYFVNLDSYHCTLNRHSQQVTMDVLTPFLAQTEFCLFASFSLGFVLQIRHLQSTFSAV